MVLQGHNVRQAMSLRGFGTALFMPKTWAICQYSNMMIDQNDGRGRRSIRLRDFDYTQEGGYFVTICAVEGRNFFGEVRDGVVALNRYGRIVSQEWLEIAEKRDNVKLDLFVTMPNHFHGILLIDNSRRGMACHAQGNVSTDPMPRKFSQPLAKSLSSIIGSFKSAVSRKINLERNLQSAPVWQRNYHEHVIRNDADLAEKRTYIENNPLQWELDEYYANKPR
jgi:putative transposase